MNYDKLIKIVDGADSVGAVRQCFMNCGGSIQACLESSRQLMELVKSMPAASKPDYDTYYIGVEEGKMCLFHTLPNRPYEVCGNRHDSPKSNGFGIGVYTSHHYDVPVSGTLSNFNNFIDSFKNGKVVVFQGGEQVATEIMNALKQVPQGL